MIPFYNLCKMFTSKQDYNWVSLELLADNKTFVGRTDSPKYLQINPETLDAIDLIEWDEEKT